MKLKDEFKKLPKDLVYDIYLSLVYSPKDYDNITREKMLDNIAKEYNQENYLYNICTEKELKFLKYIKDKEIDANDIKKYEWEINELNRKCIFSKVTYEVFEEQIENVDNALKFYSNHIKNKKSDDQIVIFIISVVKTNVEILTMALNSMISSLFGIDKEFADKILGHPLIHFYCEFYEKYLDFFNKEEEIIYYRDNYDLLDDLFELRKEYGMAGTKKLDIRDNYDIFYYGFPIRNEKVKKMYDIVSEIPLKDFIFHIINEARILNNRDFLDLFIDNKDLQKVINDALDEMPCAVMNGFTPNDYKTEKAKEEQLNFQFEVIPQNNAHLCKSAADEFYKLYLALLDYTNKKYNFFPEIKKIYKQEGLDIYKIRPIDEYLWNNKNIIDDFVSENNYKLSEDELKIISGFKTAITSDRFIIIGFEREYTKILSEDGKIYMVKGIRTDLDKLVDSKNIPLVISTTLLMFKDYIVFNSYLSNIDINFGNDFKEQVLKDSSNAIKYYHL